MADRLVEEDLAHEGDEPGFQMRVGGQLGQGARFADFFQRGRLGQEKTDRVELSFVENCCEL